MSSPPRLPSLVIVPGAFSNTISYQRLANSLRSHGLPTYILPLQTVGRRPGPAPHLANDAAFVSAEVRKLLDKDEPEDVVLIGHSYGGVVISESARGLTTRERQAQGKSGGIVKLVYVAAVIPPVGSGLGIVGMDIDNLRDDKQDPYLSFDPKAIAPTLFNDMHAEDPAAALAAASEFQEQAANAYSDVLTWPGYAYAPSVYVLAKRDSVGPPEKAREYIGVLEEHAAGGAADVEVVEIDSGHCPNASMPKELAEVIMGLLKSL